MQTSETSPSAAVEGDKTSKALLVVAVGIGYAMGSLPLGSIGETAWKDIAIFEKWVREVVVPFYTLSVLVYLPVRFFFNGEPKAKETNAERSPEEGPEAKSMVDQQHQQQENGGETEEADKPIDLTGVFKVVKNYNFDEFLRAQGLPWFLCKAASKARPTHNFMHASCSKLTIKIRGIIDSETSYQIDGPYTETTIRGRIFQDSVTYLYEREKGDNNNNNDSCDDEPAEEEGLSLSNGDERVCAGVKTCKVAVGMGYEIRVDRRIVRAGSTWIPTAEANPDGHHTYDLDTPCDIDRLIMTNKIVYDGDDSGEKSVFASQLFHRTD